MLCLNTKETFNNVCQITSYFMGHFTQLSLVFTFKRNHPTGLSTFQIRAYFKMHCIIQKALHARTNNKIKKIS